jgi:uncharacterized coiled-coil DUF342 family protein
MGDLGGEGEAAEGGGELGEMSGEGGTEGIGEEGLEESPPVEEQCQTGSLEANQYVDHGWTVIPGVKGTRVKDVFVTHGGTFGGAYATKTAPTVVRRKKGTENQWLMGLYDDKYLKMVEITLHVDGDGTIKAHSSGARNKGRMPQAEADGHIKSSDSMTAVWNSAAGQNRARSDGEAGYGIKGLTVKACLANEDAIKEGAAMNALVDNFIDAQSGAEDACHSQLLEARHQLNQLHELVIDLAREVNSTEEQIMVYDKMLEAKFKEMSDLTKWKEAEIAKCEDTRKKAIEMFGKLKAELDEMHSIANPSVAMDVKTGKLHQASLLQEVSINKHLTIAVDSAGDEDLPKQAHHHKAAHMPSVPRVERRLASGSDKETADATMVASLMAETKKASDAYKNCIGPNKAMSMALLSEGKPKTNEECEAEREALEKTYVKAYVELSRLKAEYEELANSTACFDGVNQQYNSRHPPLQQAADKLSSQINEKIHQLQGLRPRLESAKASETKLRNQVTALTAQCKNVGATVSDLDKVRDAIESLSECPGLSRVKFSMPKWVGTWATFEQDASAQDDAKQDQLMNSACIKLKAGSRAAEVGEIQEQTVEGIPASNTAPNPLMGACPSCSGADDDSYMSGHGRVCWPANAMLTLGERSTNCGTGKKAILCVMDRADVRQIPGEF